MDMILQLAIPAMLILVAIIAIGMVIGRLYHRAEKDRSYVRTGFGGQKVVLDGGSIVLPIFQSIAWVNLQTLRLDVRRDSQDAMITKDRMRVDIGVEFYVRVKPDASSIALAAQTLGNRTNDVIQLRELVEAKFVDALRSVAATMILADLQEKRSDFVKAVQAAVATDLELNGLELESASLTKLDQTDTKFFNPNNAFDAEGLTALTKIVEAKRQERNQTIRNAEVAIAQQDLDATQKTLEILRLKKDAELSQQRDITNKTAETRAAAALKEAEASRAEAEAKITAQQSIAEKQAAAKQVQESAAIAANLAIQQKQIESERASETLRIGKHECNRLVACHLVRANENVGLRGNCRRFDHSGVKGCLVHRRAVPEDLSGFVDIDTDFLRLVHHAGWLADRHFHVHRMQLDRNGDDKHDDQHQHHVD